MKALDKLCHKNQEYEISGVHGIIDVMNSDIITCLGSSFGETYGFFPINKHWSGIMSMFSDYRFQNQSSGGSNKVTNLNFIRTGKWKIYGKYVMVSNDENIGQLDVAQTVKALDNLCKTIESLGAEPIICTSYHKYPTQSSVYKNYAEKHNYMHWDASVYCHSLNSGLCKEFDDGAHLRKRNIPMVAVAYMNHLNKMERPLQSLKVFRVRNAFSGELDDLVFSNNVERAKCFKEIAIEHNQTKDEYNILAEGGSLSFNNYALISCVLPSLAKDLKNVSLKLTASKNIEVYVRDTMIAPYPSIDNNSYVRFSISSNINVPEIGDIYSCEDTNYTIKHVVMGENDYYCTIYCSPSTIPTAAKGTLTLVSGGGSGSIPYSLVEISSYGIENMIVDDNNGHWIDITNSNEGYKIPIETYKGVIDRDKVHFLVKCDGAFELSNISIEYFAERYKDIEHRKLFEWSQNDYYQTEELLPESTFGVVGTETTHWKDDSSNSITSIESYGGKYPAGANSEIIINNTTALNYTVPSPSLEKSGTIWLECYCRYFPQAPADYTQTNDTEVNGDSYDFNTLSIDIGNTLQKATFTEEIGLMWQIVRIPIQWYKPNFGNQNTLPIRIYSNSKGIEICKVSLKYNK